MGKKSVGFSLIELMVVAVISGILLTGGIAAYRNIGGKQQVKQAGISFQTNLRLFQERALAGLKPEECVVNTFLGYVMSYVDESNYTATPICDGVVTATSFELDNGVEFQSDWGSIVYNNQQSGISGEQIIKIVKEDLVVLYKVSIDKNGVTSGEMVSE